MNFAIITEKRWNIETRGVYNQGLSLKGLKVEKYLGFYFLGFIPLYIKHLGTEYHSLP